MSRLENLSEMIRKVYIPAMEDKADIKHNMTKFMNQITSSLSQAYGSVTIEVPEIPEGMNDRAVERDDALMKKLQDAVVSTLSRIR